MTWKIGIAALAYVAILIVFFAALWWRLRHVPTCPGCARPAWRCSCDEDIADLVADRHQRIVHRARNDQRERRSLRTASDTPWTVDKK